MGLDAQPLEPGHLNAMVPFGSFQEFVLVAGSMQRLACIVPFSQ